MPVFNINALSKPDIKGKENDLSNPYSFQEWKQRRVNIDDFSQKEQYNSYLKNWYKVNTQKPQTTINYTKTLYLNFLKELGLTTRNEEEKIFFSDINYDSDLELQSALTFYARKLKDVSKYIAEKRKQITNIKLKYNLQGTTTHLERLFYNYILSVFTQRQDLSNSGLIVTNGELVQYLPKLSEISGVFSIEIEELYDTKNYFDRDKTVDISRYTTVSPGVDVELYKIGLYEIPAEFIISTIMSTLATASDTISYQGISGFVGTSVNSMQETNVYIYTGDGSTNTFVLENITESRASAYRVTIDGVVQTPNTGYTINVGNSTITFNDIPPSGTEIVVVI